VRIETYRGCWTRQLHQPFTPIRGCGLKHADTRFTDADLDGSPPYGGAD